MDNKNSNSQLISDNKTSKLQMTKLHLVECHTSFYPDKGATHTVQRLIDVDRPTVEYTTEEWTPLSEDDALKLIFELPDFIVKQKFQRVVKKAL